MSIRAQSKYKPPATTWQRCNISPSVEQPFQSQPIYNSVAVGKEARCRATFWGFRSLVLGLGEDIKRKVNATAAVHGIVKHLVHWFVGTQLSDKLSSGFLVVLGSHKTHGVCQTTDPDMQTPNEANSLLGMSVCLH